MGATKCRTAFQVLKFRLEQLVQEKISSPAYSRPGVLDLGTATCFWKGLYILCAGEGRGGEGEREKDTLNLTWTCNS